MSSVPRRTRFLSLAVTLAALASVHRAQAQTLPSRPPHVQLRAELDNLIEVGVARPYGLTFADPPEQRASNAPPPLVNLDAGGTPAVGLVLLLSGQILSDPRYRDAAVQVSKAMVFSMDPSGRVPPTAVSGPGSFSQKERPGYYPRRSPSFATTALLLMMDRDLAGQDARVASGAVRATNWVLKQQINPGVYTTPTDVRGEQYPNRLIRLDLPDTRDAVLCLLLTGRTGEGRESSLPLANARAQARRAADQLLRFRATEVLRPSKQLWYAAYGVDGTPFDKLPELPPVGHAIASRYALQALLAYHLDTLDAGTFEYIQASAQALAARKNADGTWPLVDDPKNLYPPPAPARQWETGDYGIPAVLRAVNDVRVLGPVTFGRLANHALPPEQAYAAVVAGLTDQLPAADLPVSASQVELYVAAHPETFESIRGPIPTDLPSRARRLWALYLLTRWEYLFTTK